MLSIEVCRKILGVSQAQMSDEQIEEARDTIYQVANVLVTSYIERAENNE